MIINDETRFLYVVCPKKPIKNLREDLSLIRTSRSLYLTKEEVLKCLECGSVYRRFSNEGIQEKCNKYDLDRVHREKYISKDDWKKLEANAEKVDNLVVNGVSEEPQEIVQEEKVQLVQEEQPKEEVVTSVEEVVVEDTVIEETPKIEAETAEIEDTPVVIEETATNDEIIEDTVVEEEDIESVEEDFEIDNEESSDEEVSTTNNSNIVVNYNGKKKKHHH